MADQHGERVRILAVDVGTGTQDILLFESDRAIENCLQLIMPSPTVILAERIRRATAAAKPVLLTGRIMGGGPVGWAARDHAQAGLPCYATPDAARTLDDDLTMVEAQGLRIVDEDEANDLLRRHDADALAHIEMRDFDASVIRAALAAFDVDPHMDAVAVAAFDHGAAPPGVSDRRYRFDAISARVRERPDPLAFAYRAADLPAALTRLAAVADDAAHFNANLGSTEALPVVVMDTGAAALAGALEDSLVRARAGGAGALVANIGNFHTLAFALAAGRIIGLFEHHTGLLDQTKLEGYLRELAAGTLSNERIFDDSGHGALTLQKVQWENAGEAGEMPFLAVTGPRRALLRGSALAPYEAVPHGDMMLAGCFGLLRAVQFYEPRFAKPIEGVLGQGAGI